MIQFSFFHSPKPRGFNHKPIYWNPDEEAKRERAERLRSVNDGGEYRTSLKRGSFRQQRKNADADDDVKRVRRQSNQRFLLIFAVLLLLVVFIFYFI